MKKRILLALTLLLMISIVGGCKDNELSKEDKTPEEIEKAEEEKVADLKKEREELEVTRREEMGEFYVPLPPLGEDKKAPTVEAKALYITGNVAGFKFEEENIDYYANYIKAISGQSDEAADSSRLDELNKLEKALGIAKATEINSLVIDIKDDDGDVTWESDLEIVSQVASNSNITIKDRQALFDYLDENEIYKIARIVAFKDPLFAKAKAEHAILLKEGGVYLDHAGESWVNPFSKYVWDYLLSLSKEAALRGFDEIQYDYVRFPDGAAHYNPITEFPGRDGRDKDEGIEDFLAYAKEKLEAYNVHVSADVFGIVTNSWDDTPDDIGQTWRKVANQVEYICPMIYPSHYGPGLYGYDVPDKYPYEIARAAVMEAIERNAAQKEPALIRPWFQGFSAPWVRGNINYDAKAISDQMVAASELGVKEYIIWSASNNYDPMSFFYQDRIDKSKYKEDEDIMGRTAEKALERFFEAEKNARYNQLYLLTPIEERKEDYDDFVAEIETINPLLKAYTISSIKENDEGYLANVNVSYISDKGSFTSENAEYEIIREKEVFKIKTPEKKWEKEASEKVDKEETNEKEIKEKE